MAERFVILETVPTRGGVRITGVRWSADDWPGSFAETVLDVTRCYLDACPPDALAIHVRQHLRALGWEAEVRVEVGNGPPSAEDAPGRADGGGEATGQGRAANGAQAGAEAGESRSGETGGAGPGIPSAAALAQEIVDALWAKVEPRDPNPNPHNVRVVADRIVWDMPTERARCVVCGHLFLRLQCSWASRCTGCGPSI